jgi:hypothetical protein
MIKIVTALLLSSFLCSAQTCVRVRQTGMLNIGNTPANGKVVVSLGYTSAAGSYVLIQSATFTVNNGTFNECLPPGSYGTAAFTLNDPTTPGAVFQTYSRNWFVPATGGPYTITYVQQVQQPVNVYGDQIFLGKFDASGVLMQKNRQVTVLPTVCTSQYEQVTLLNGVSNPSSFINTNNAPPACTWTSNTGSSLVNVDTVNNSFNIGTTLNTLGNPTIPVLTATVVEGRVTDGVNRYSSNTLFIRSAFSGTAPYISAVRSINADSYTTSTSTGDLTRISSGGGLVGISGYAEHYGSGTITKMSGMASGVNMVTASGTVVEANSHDLLAPLVAAGGTLTTYAAVKVESSPVIGTLSSNFGLLVQPLQAGSFRMAIRVSDPSYFGGGSQPGIVSYASLPSCNQTYMGGVNGVFGTDGIEFTLSDASTNVVNAAVTGGGSGTSTPVKCDGVSGVYRVMSGTISSGQVIGSNQFLTDVVGNRLLLQTTVPNTRTHLRIIPNGTSTGSNITLSNSSDPINYGVLSHNVSGNQANLSFAVILGTGTRIDRLTVTGGPGNPPPDLGGWVSIATGVTHGGAYDTLYAPATSNESCYTGQRFTGTPGGGLYYDYRCVATNTWVRSTTAFVTF